MLFINLYNASVERFWEGPELLQDNTANYLIHAAIAVAREQVTTLEDAVELMADMIRNRPFPCSYELEADNWIDLAVLLFRNAADEHSTSDAAIQAEETRRVRAENALAPVRN